MEKEFVPYELALRMKALNYNEPCMAYYNKSKKLYFDKYTTSHWPSTCLAPTYSQAFRWFREKHFYISYVCAPYKEHDEFYFRIRHIGDVINEGQLESCESQVYNTYEEAELHCLEKLIDIVEGKSE